MTVVSTVKGRAVLRPQLINFVATLGACIGSGLTTILRQNIKFYALRQQQDTHYINKEINMPMSVPPTMNGALQCQWRSRPLDEGTADLHQENSVLNFLAPPANSADLSHYANIESSVLNKAR